MFSISDKDIAAIVAASERGGEFPATGELPVAAHGAEGRAPCHHSATASRNHLSPPGTSPSSAAASASESGQPAPSRLSASAPASQQAPASRDAGTGAS